MRMLNALDMSGNQIKNFLAENGRVSGDNPLAAQTGRLAYDTGDRSLYLGYQEAGTNKLNWSRLVDVAHLAQSLSGDAVYKWAKDIRGSKVEIDENTFTLEAAAVVSLLEHGGNAYSWGNHAEQGYGVVEEIYIELVPTGYVANENLTSPDQVNGNVYLVLDSARKRLFLKGFDAATGDVKYFARWLQIDSLGVKEMRYYSSHIVLGVSSEGTMCIGVNGSWSILDDGEDYNFVHTIRNNGYSASQVIRYLNNGATAYNWGNHANAGYAKAYKIDAVYDVSSMPTHADRAALVSASGKSDWVQSELAFDVTNKRLLCKCTRTEGDKTFEGYIRTWSAVNNINDPSFYTKENTLLFVNGILVYKYESGAWALYLSGTSGDAADRIKAIEDLLNVGNNLITAIDTWQELTKFLGGIKPSENGLYTWMTNTESSINDLAESKADKDEVIMQPVEVGNDDDVLTLQSNGSAKWSTRKIVSHLGNIVERDELEGVLQNNNWYIDITSIGTTDVSVSLYFDSDGRGTWEQFLADVSVYEYQDGDPVVSGIRVKVSFGTIPAQDVKAVIIA